jgi:hypothetical protein
MWQDFDDEGFAGLTPYLAQNEFAVTVEGLISIAERQYNILLCADPTFYKICFKRNVCVVHYDPLVWKIDSN